MSALYLQLQFIFPVSCYSKGRLGKTGITSGNILCQCTVHVLPAANLPLITVLLIPVPILKHKAPSAIQHFTFYCNDIMVRFYCMQQNILCHHSGIRISRYVLFYVISYEIYLRVLPDCTILYIFNHDLRISDNRVRFCSKSKTAFGIILYRYTVVYPCHFQLNPVISLMIHEKLLYIIVGCSVCLVVIKPDHIRFPVDIVHITQ